MASMASSNTHHFYPNKFKSKVYTSKSCFFPCIVSCKEQEQQQPWQDESTKQMGRRYSPSKKKLPPPPSPWERQTPWTLLCLVWNYESATSKSFLLMGIALNLAHWYIRICREIILRSSEIAVLGALFNFRHVFFVPSCILLAAFLTFKFLICLVLRPSWYLLATN